MAFLFTGSPTASAQLGLCSAYFGDNPPTTHPGRDGAEGLIVVDQTHGGLPAGTLDSWTVDNSGTAAPILMQAWRAVGSRTFKLVCETKAVSLTAEAVLKSPLFNRKQC